MLNKQKIQKSKHYDIKSVTKKSSKTSYKLCKFIWQAKKFLEIGGACNNSISSLYNKMKKMVESENIPGNHKALRIRIRAITKSQLILRFVLD